MRARRKVLSEIEPESPMIDNIKDVQRSSLGEGCDDSSDGQFSSEELSHRPDRLRTALKSYGIRL